MRPNYAQNVAVNGLGALLRRIEALKECVVGLKNLDEEMDAHFNFSFKEEKLPIIDLALGMKRIWTKHEEKAIKILSIFLETLKEDIPRLQEAQKSNDIRAC